MDGLPAPLAVRSRWPQVRRTLAPILSLSLSITSIAQADTEPIQANNTDIRGCLLPDILITLADIESTRTYYFPLSDLHLGARLSQRIDISSVCIDRTIRMALRNGI